MAPRKARVPLLVRLRTPLMLLVVAGVGGTLALYLVDRDPPAVQPGGGPAPLAAPAEDVTTTGEGFDYSHYEDDRRLFRIQGARYTVDRNEIANLQDVLVTLYRPDGEYQAESARALYRQRNESAELEEDVHLWGPGGLEMWTPKLSVAPRGRRVTSPERARFHYKESLQGAADRIRVEVPDKLYLLQGNVEISTRPGEAIPGELKAQRAYLEELERLLRAEGQVELRYGGDFLKARRMSVYLAEHADVPRFIRAKWGVQGRMRVQRESFGDLGEQEARAEAGDPEAGDPEAGGRLVPLRFSAEIFAMVFDPQGGDVRKIELEGGANQVAELRSRAAATGLRRLMSASYMVGDFGAGSLQGVQAFGQVRVSEHPPQGEGGSPLRLVRSEQARGRFLADGTLELVTFIGNVDYREPPNRMASARAEVNLDTGEGTFLGSPARFENDRGEVTAERLIYDRRTARLRAFGGVRASIEQAATGSVMPETLMGRGEGPVWMEAAEAEWLEEAGTLDLRGRVRAWRGQNLLLADVMEVRGEGEALRAEGHVKTVFFPERRAGTGEDGPMEVDAGRLDYRGAAGTMRYERDVVLLDGPRTMECAALDVEMEEDGRTLRRMVCSGGAKMIDRTEAKQVEAEAAIYLASEGRIDFRGQPVELRDRAGNQLQGARVLYDIESGAARVMSTAGEGEAP